MKSPKILIIIFIIFVFSIFGFFFLRTKQPLQNIQQEKAQNIPAPPDEKDIYLNDIENNKNPDFVVAKKALETGDIKNAPALWEKVVKSDEIAGKFKNTNSTKPKVSSKTFLAASYLEYGNYYYREKESAEKAIKILTENVDNEDYGAYGMYFVGYAYEITKQYEKSLEWYEKGLKISSNTTSLNSIFKNQIGHVYDLKGDSNKAYEYYTQAYALNDKNYQASTNIGRYLARIGKLKESIPYFKYALNTKNPSLRSEIYYTLSSMELDLNGLSPDIDKSIQYAQASIKSFPDYPMGYVALARGLYMKNDKKYDKEIEENLLKSIRLNPNGFAAYKYYALYLFDLGDIKASSVLMAKSNDVLDKDVILMDNVRSTEKDINTMIMRSLFVIDKINQEGTKKNKDTIEKFLLEKYFASFIDLQKKRVNNGVLKSFIQ